MIEPRLTGYRLLSDLRRPVWRERLEGRGFAFSDLSPTEIETLAPVLAVVAVVATVLPAIHPVGCCKNEG